MLTPLPQIEAGLSRYFSGSVVKMNFCLTLSTNNVACGASRVSAFSQRVPTKLGKGCGAQLVAVPILDYTNNNRYLRTMFVPPLFRDGGGGTVFQL